MRLGISEGLPGCVPPGSTRAGLSTICLTPCSTLRPLRRQFIQLTGLTSALRREPAVPSTPAASVTSHRQMGADTPGMASPIVFPSQTTQTRTGMGDLKHRRKALKPHPLVSAHLKEDAGSARQGNECSAGERGGVQTKPI